LREPGDFVLAAGVLLLILGATNHLAGAIAPATATPSSAALGLIFIGAGAGLKKRSRRLQDPGGPSRASSGQREVEELRQTEPEDCFLR